MTYLQGRKAPPDKVARLFRLPGLILGARSCPTVRDGDVRSRDGAPNLSFRRLLPATRKPVRRERQMMLADARKMRAWPLGRSKDFGDTSHT